MVKVGRRAPGTSCFEHSRAFQPVPGSVPGAGVGTFHQRSKGKRSDIIICLDGSPGVSRQRDDCIGPWVDLPFRDPSDALKDSIG